MMPPRTVQSRNKSKNDIFIKKINRSLIINKKLRKRIQELSDNNKYLSSTRNNLLLDKMALQRENNSIKNTNIQLTAMQNIMRSKLGELEKTIQSCIPALVTVSQCVPSVLENIHNMNKFEVIDFNKEKKEKQTKFVRPMINGLTIENPIVSLKRFDMSTIVESPSSEQTPKRSRRSSNRISPICKLNLEPYVRLKDVAAMMKNSKAISNESPRRQLNESLGEGPSWLHTPENQTQNANNNTITPTNEFQADMTPVASTSSNNFDNTFNVTEVQPSPIDTSMMRNITCRKRNQRPSETSNESYFDDSTSSERPSRSAKKNINYHERNINSKLRR